MFRAIGTWLYGSNAGIISLCYGCLSLLEEKLEFMPERRFDHDADQLCHLKLGFKGINGRK